MIEIYENFASKYLKLDIADVILSPTFPWNFHDQTSEKPIVGDTDFTSIVDSKTFDSPQCVHLFHSREPEHKVITPLIYNIMDLVDDYVKFDRIKANLMFPQVNNPGKDFYSIPHIDYPQTWAKSLIYYVNDADGDTFFFDKRYVDKHHPGELNIVKRVTPKAGTAVLFDSMQYHASQSPTLGKRSVINFIFWKASDAPPPTAFHYNGPGPMAKIFPSILNNEN
jgi:hypothetical protein